ncbi:hypothetical protein AVEN_24240-1 [Araneus ventricosus]|uniref:Uncharacterized protein n=1 Tax=Araneus ventricosus TaxID=182803 RepID=A0A4Y2G388_ARAVE|nr:hypothetical protein AVEN_24240-1 [Araneus ventricosus]
MKRTTHKLSSPTLPKLRIKSRGVWRQTSHLTFQLARVCERYSREEFRFISLYQRTLRKHDLGYSASFFRRTVSHRLEFEVLIGLCESAICISEIRSTVAVK